MTLLSRLELQTVALSKSVFERIVGKHQERTRWATTRAYTSLTATRRYLAVANIPRLMGYSALRRTALVTPSGMTPPIRSGSAVMHKQSARPLPAPSTTPQ